MTRFLLVRHGETEWNRIRRVQGQTDVPLNATGEAQATAVAARLAEEQFDLCFASDLRRAYTTAEVIVAHHPQLNIQKDTRLREINLGSWETRLWSEIEAAEPERVAAWRENISSVVVPGAETPQQLYGRAKAFQQEIFATYPQKSILVVAHGGLIRAFISAAFGLPAAAAWQFGTDNTSIAEIYLLPDVEWPYLARLNDTYHLYTADLEKTGRD